MANGASASTGQPLCSTSTKGHANARGAPNARSPARTGSSSRATARRFGRAAGALSPSPTGRRLGTAAQSSASLLTECSWTRTAGRRGRPLEQHTGQRVLLVGSERLRNDTRFFGQIAQIGLGGFAHWENTAPIANLEEYLRRLPYSSQLNGNCPGGGASVQLRNISHISLFGDAMSLDGKVPGIMQLLSNISYDFETDWRDTTVFGLPRTGDNDHVKSDEISHFVVTMRNKCRRKRPVGGADLSAAILLPTKPDVEFPLSLVDTMDGNYHAEFNVSDVVEAFNGICSRDYKVRIVWENDTNVFTPALTTTRELEIRPSVTSPVTTNIFKPSDNDDTGCFGVVNRWRIQARDAQRCVKLPLLPDEREDRFRVRLTGPAEIEAEVVYVPGSTGVYDVYWFAPVAGTYHLTAYLDVPGWGWEPIHGSGMCVDVCAGKSLEFRGSDELENEGWIEIRSEPAGLNNLELADPEGFTMEAWFLIAGTARKGAAGVSQSTDRPYLLLKHGHISGEIVTDRHIKGYSLGFDPAYENITATVYCSLGRYREVVADIRTFVDNTWIHVAAVYNLTAYSLYLDGELASQALFDEALPPHPNLYNHPLTIGMGFRGSIDEVTLWRRPRTHDEIVQNMFCPPYLSLEDVAGYWSFNGFTLRDDRSGTRPAAYLMGAGAGCVPMSPEATDKANGYESTCLVAETRCLKHSMFLPIISDINPLKVSAYGRGMGAPSPRYSEVSGPGLSSARAYDFETDILTVHMRDQCGFKYNRGFPFGRSPANPTIEDPNTPRVAALVTSTTQPFELIYYTDDPPLQSLPYGYPITEEGPLEPTVVATHEYGPCILSMDIQEAENSGTTFEMPVRATKKGNSYLDIRLLGAPLTSYRTPIMLSDKYNETQFAPYVLPIKSGPPVAIEFVSDLRMVYAGVPAGVTVLLKDEGGNRVGPEFPISASIHVVGISNGGPEYPSKVTYLGDGLYHILLTAPSAGPYSLSVVLEPMPEVLLAITASVGFPVMASPARPLLTASFAVPVEAHRFEHSAVVFNDELYVWGGAGAITGAHRSDMWRLQLNSKDPRHGALAWRKPVSVSLSSATDNRVTLKVFVNTLELLQAGRVQDSCADVAFVMPPRTELEEEHLLPYHMDRYPGCGSESTIFWVTLDRDISSPGETTIYMLYGNPHPHQVDYEQSAEALEFYDGFEDGVDGSMRGTRLKPSTPCGSVIPDSSFEVTSELSFAGSKSLKGVFGDRGAAEYILGKTLNAFTMRAAFYDNNAINSSHFMSPNYDRCRVTMGGKPLAPNPDEEVLDAVSTAMGSFSLSHVFRLCVSTPWTSTDTTRSARWRQLEVTSTPEDGLKILINGETVKTTDPITLDRVFLSAGFGIDNATVPGLPMSMAMWDDVFVAALTPTATADAAPISSDEPVAWIPRRVWEPVPLAEGSPAPPSRQGQCTFFHAEDLFVFGGERAGYAFRDLWRFSFSNRSWTLVADGPIPARHDAACFVMPDEGLLVVHGGKSERSILSDAWAYNLTTAEWVELDMSAGQRFGHSAVLIDRAAYIFGGFSGSGFSNNLVSCTQQRATVFQCQGFTSNPEVMPRFAHTAFAHGVYMYVHGGTNLESRSGLADTWRYSTTVFTWERVDDTEAGKAALQHNGLISQPLHLAGDSRHGGFIVHGGTNSRNQTVHYLTL
uniref:DUF2341 domain-containing protein n=1 Tax=Tetraselmis sp. GSL018 TaxID=582737 RepID=A0A061RV63_9CHLO